MPSSSRKATRREVAVAAGVSTAVVSYVLNGKACENRIPESTCSRVQAAALALGYKKNVWATILKNQRSRLLAFVSQDLTDPNTAEIISAFNTVVLQKGFGLTLFEIRDPQFFSAKDMQQMAAQVADGIFFHAPRAPLSLLKATSPLHEKPFCVLGQHLENGSLPSVEVDNATGAAMAMSHLQELGVKQFGIVANRPHYHFTQQRMTGCRNVLKQQSGCDIRVYYQQENENQHSAGVSAMEQWLQEGHVPQGIFAMGDELALGVLSVLHAKKIPCPDRVRLIGFDGTRISAFVYPSVTTIRQPFTAIAETAMSIMLDLLAGKQPEQPNRLLRPELIIRSSTCRT